MRERADVQLINSGDPISGHSSIALLPLVKRSPFKGICNRYSMIPTLVDFATLLLTQSNVPMQYDIK